MRFSPQSQQWVLCRVNSERKYQHLDCIFMWWAENSQPDIGWDQFRCFPLRHLPAARFLSSLTYSLWGIIPWHWSLCCIYIATKLFVKRCIWTIRRRYYLQYKHCKCPQEITNILRLFTWIQWRNFHWRLLVFSDISETIPSVRKVETISFN